MPLADYQIEIDGLTIGDGTHFRLTSVVDALEVSDELITRSVYSSTATRKFPSRTLQIELTITGTDTANFDSNVNAFRSACSGINLKSCAIKMPGWCDGEEVYFDALCSVEQQVDLETAFGAAKISASLLMLDGRFFSGVNQVLTSTNSPGSGTFSVTNAGNCETDWSAHRSNNSAQIPSSVEFIVAPNSSVKGNFTLTGGRDQWVFDSKYSVIGAHAEDTLKYPGSSLGFTESEAVNILQLAQQDYLNRWRLLQPGTWLISYTMVGSAGAQNIAFQWRDAWL